MVNYPRLIPLLLWLIFDINFTKALFNCPKITNCNCLQLGQIFEFTCLEQNDPNRNVLIEYQPNILKLQCTNITQFNQDLVKNLNIGETIETIEIKFCPLPVGNFKQIFTNLLEISNIKMLIFRYTTIEFQQLPNNLLDGFINLEIFDFSNNLLKDVDEEIFRNTPNLTTINLSTNRIKFKTNHFKSLKLLRKLNIADNRLGELPNGIFRDLSNLTKLELWRNRLGVLKSDIFDDLINLKLLELSSNQLGDIDGDLFKKLTNLQQLGLNNNNLSRLPVDLFSNNRNLEILRLENNVFKQLEDEVFENLINLKEINLSNCSLTDLSPTIFTNLQQLRVIRLQSNQIRFLSHDWFKSLSKLEQINLNDNRIENLINFPVMDQLKSLYLRNNSLQQLNNNHLENLRNLTELDLSWNSITSIEHGVFVNNQRLIKLNLSHNNYTLTNQIFKSLNPFTYCTHLQEFDLSYNRIEEVDQFLILNMLDLRRINLSNNRLEFISSNFMATLTANKVEMDLSNNNITTIDFNIIELEVISEENYNRRGSIVNLNNNPFNCDCNLYPIWKYFQNQLNPSIRNFITFVDDDLICMSPMGLRNISIKSLNAKQLVCELDKMKCPKGCDCDWRAYDQAIIIDCSYRNLTQMPHYQFAYNDVRFKDVEVHLEGNGLENITKDTVPGYENVTKLCVTNNRIEKLDWLPSKLKVLDVRNNRLNRISAEILERFKIMKNISLENNPWICDCSAANFALFLRTNHDKINPIDILCDNNTTRLVDLNKSDLCKTQIIAIYTSCALLLVCLLITAVIAFYYRYQQEIKVWLYARNWCLWWVTEEDLDKDKIYDAFISYSNQDEEFVMEKLVGKLETGPNPYKLCLHKRDWVPGEFITTQIINSVQNSKRTIVILSPNFLESVWAKMEFRTAHTQAMKEGRVRLIVVLLHDIDPNRLDDEIKAYLKTNTYVQWGNPHFYNQLRYALPHSKRLRIEEKKKIDDRAMITNGFISNQQTTLPVLNLDGGLLKNHPLNLTATL